VSSEKNNIEVVTRPVALIEAYEELMHLALRENNDFYTLADIDESDPEEITTKSVNMLFVVREVCFSSVVFFSQKIT
jgi:hypothetical protein